VPRTYATYEQAERRVEALKRQGIWPGIIGSAGRGYRLTQDPRDDGGDDDPR